MSDTPQPTPEDPTTPHEPVPDSTDLPVPATSEPDDIPSPNLAAQPDPSVTQTSTPIRVPLKSTHDPRLIHPRASLTRRRGPVLYEYDLLEWAIRLGFLALGILATWFLMSHL